MTDRPKRRVAIEPRELEQLLRDRVRSVAPHLLSNGREECGYWRVGSIENEPGQSLALNLEGPLRGCWTDFSAPEGTPERAGDLLQLAARTMFGGRLADAITWAISWLGLDGLDPGRLRTEKARAQRELADSGQEAARRAEQRRRSAQHLYLSGQPIIDTPAEAYLVSRGIDLRAAGLKAPGSLKYHPAVTCKEAGRRLPCMVAGVVSLEGALIAAHRTWIQADGAGKAALVEPKKALGQYGGGFIPLWKGEHRCSMKGLPAGTPVLVSEGIEDGLSAALARPQHRVIAAVALGNIGGLQLPEGVGPVIILAQHDANQAALDSLDKAVGRLQERGLEVRLAYPPDGVKDLNDLLRAPDGAVGDLPLEAGGQ